MSQPVTVSAAMQIGASAKVSDLAVLPNGTIVTAFTTTADNHIAAQLIDSQGQKIGSEIRVVENGGAGFPDEPTVTALTDGRFLVSWSATKYDDTVGTYFVHLRGQIYNADGSVSLPDFALTDQTTANGSQYRHDTAALPGGGFELTYQQGSNDGSHDGFFSQAFGPDGSKVGANGAIQTGPYPGNTLQIPDIAHLATLTNGAVAIASESGYNGGAIYTQIISNVGTTGPVQISSGDSASYDLGATIVALDTGGYAVAWRHFNTETDTSPQDPYYTIQGVVLKNDGTTVDASFSLTTSVPTTSTFNLSLAALDAGKFAVSYAYTDVIGQEFNADGSKLGSAFVIASHTSDDNLKFPASIGLGNGQYLVSWSGSNSGELDDALISPIPTSWDRYSSPAETTLLASGATFASVLAGATAGNELALVNPAGTPITVGDQSVSVNNLTVKGDASLFGDFVLAGNVTAFTLAGTTNAAVTGNALSNKITGSDGDNTLVGGGGNDTMNGGGGNDTADYSAASGALAISLAKTVAQNVGSGLGADTLISIENLVGGSGNDKLTGSAVANVLTGGGGNDILDGGAGADTMYGGAGDDTYLVDESGDVVSETKTAGVDDGGIDTVQSSISFTLGAFVENLTLTGTGAIDGTGNSLANKIVGNNGANHLIGGAGADTLTGGVGADILEGGEDGDTYYADSVDTILDTGLNGTDTVITNGSSIVLATGDGIENLAAATGGTTNTNLTGNEAANRITGNNGSNYLKGMAGNDTLSGGLGDDRLEGGLGKDTLTGGGGMDTFIFKGNDSPSSVSPIVYDSITDFLSGTDKIDLDVVGKAGLTASQFSATSIATNSYATAFSAAQAQFADALHKAVFVAGTADGWLFWNNDADATTADAAVRLAGANSTGAIQRSDII